LSIITLLIIFTFELSFTAIPMSHPENKLLKIIVVSLESSPMLKHLSGESLNLLLKIIKSDDPDKSNPSPSMFVSCPLSKKSLFDTTPVVPSKSRPSNLLLLKTLFLIFYFTIFYILIRHHHLQIETYNFQ